ncbi:MAG: pyridoxal-phosphate dependent enzyme [Gammaproteobacteria bacterium]|nr:pyridoxal-phosphate dependent enzyme [Gammaproteobacteria bacterium]
MTAGHEPDLAVIEAAAARIAGVALETPLLQSPALDERVGGRVLLKAECLQRTGSFKIRGACNRLAQIPPEERERGVVAWSSGNHAQGVAEAARLLGMQATIVMPEDTPRRKLEATRRLGAEIRPYNRYREDREAIGRAIAAERGATLVPSYDDYAVIAGQGTVGLEICRQARALGAIPDRVLVCCGGGGLGAGIALAAEALAPEADIWAVEPAAFDDTARSLASGRRETVAPEARSVCDALLTPSPGRLTFPVLARRLAGAVTVTDGEAVDAMRYAFEELHLVLEPGGAVALAAVLAGKVDSGGTTVVVLSGGNIAGEDFCRLTGSGAAS